MLNMLRSLDFSAISILLFGIVLLAFGIVAVIAKAGLTFGLGVGTFGIGVMSLGITNGFTDSTHLGRVFFKVGTVSLLAGAAMVVFSFRKSFSY